MNKLSLIPLLVLIGAMVVVMATREDSPGRPAATNPPAAPAAVPLPSGISHVENGPRQHVYTISGIYNPLGHQTLPEGTGAVYRTLVPSCVNFGMDYGKKTCTFTTLGKLDVPVLADALGELAQLGGEVPTFDELQARDIPPSPLAGKFHFKLSTDTTQGTDRLDWIRMPENSESLRLPLALGTDGPGTLFIVPSTAHCMVHSRFVIRILDSNGLLLWSDDETGYGTLEIALAASTAGASQNIHVFRNNHGVEDGFLIHQ